VVQLKEVMNYEDDEWRAFVGYTGEERPVIILALRREQEDSGTIGRVARWFSFFLCCA
jgi:hypothetical protein